jgi:beta-lactam-binding protein with PASTA domain
MLEFLLVTVIVLSIVITGLLIFIWNQFNNTDSKLVKLIEDRIKLNNLHYELDRLEFPIEEE